MILENEAKMLAAIHRIDANVTRLVQKLDEHEREVQAAQERYFRDMEQMAENFRTPNAIHTEALNAALSTDSYGAHPVSPRTVTWFFGTLIVAMCAVVAWMYFL
jgi:hypothetical protein